MRLNEAGGSVGGILVLWDNKVLTWKWECSLSLYQFKNYDVGVCGPILKRREDFWAELGAIRVFRMIPGA